MNSTFFSIVSVLQNMYGQKQIIQCAAIAIILVVLNFHRSALEQNKAIAKARMKRLSDVKLNIRHHLTESDKKGNEFALSHNLTGYCLKNPFGKNLFGKYDGNSTHCDRICFDQFEMWLHRQCKADCCVLKWTESVACHLNIDGVRKSTTIQSKETRTPDTKNTAVMIRVEYEEKGAGLYNSNQNQKQHHRQQQKIDLMQTISDSINRKVMGRIIYNQSHENECQNPYFNQFIRENTTSAETNQTKLETNQSKQIMEYHDFLFDMGMPELKQKSSFPHDLGMEKNYNFFSRVISYRNAIYILIIGTVIISMFALLSFIVALLTIRYMFKIFFMNNHVSKL